MSPCIHNSTIWGIKEIDFAVLKPLFAVPLQHSLRILIYKREGIRWFKKIGVRVRVRQRQRETVGECERRTVYVCARVCMREREGVRWIERIRVRVR